MPLHQSLTCKRLGRKSFRACATLRIRRKDNEAEQPCNEPASLLTPLSSGRQIATEFLDLPARDELPEYYEVIKLPVALDTIEKKLKRNGYPTITTIESDLKRMVQNAKEFNDPKSEIYEDAERIRKHVFNFMKLNNPAYKDDPKYTAFPTPVTKAGSIPVQNGTREESEDEAPKPRKSPEKPKQASTSRGSEQRDRKSSMAPSAATGDADADEAEDDIGDDEERTDDVDFTGKTFQEAQQAIVSYMLHYIDEE